MRGNWLYKKFASIKTSVWLLGILCIFFLMGTIFPQGKSYAPEGGVLLRVLKFIDVLNIFTAPLFLTAAALLFINQLICAYERLRLLLRRASPAINEEVLREDPRTLCIPLPSSDATSDAAVAKALADLGFRLREDSSSGSNSTGTREKGINPHWPSWIFHTALLALLAGFAVSYLFAFEGELSLLPGETREVSTRSSTARWNRLRGKEVEPGAGKTFRIGLEKFITEYTQFPRLSYPPKGAGRLSLIADLTGDRVAYTVPEDSLFPRDWFSRMVVYKKGREPIRKTIQVNDPLRHGGITFYQMNISQKMVLAVDGRRNTIEVRPGQPFEVPGIDGKLRADTLRVGTLHKKGGGRERIRPYANLKLIREGKQGKETIQSAGRLVQGLPLTVQGVTLILKSWQEASVLSYRYDPGRPVLWLSAVVLLAAMTFRIWACWYRVEHLTAETDGQRRLYLRIMYNGLLADGERMIRKIRSALSSP